MGEGDDEKDNQKERGREEDYTFFFSATQINGDETVPLHRIESV